MEKNPVKQSKLAPQVFAALSGTLIMTGVGFHFGWASPTLPKLLENPSIPVTIGQGTLIISSMMVGGFAGPLISLVIVDRWGRKMSMLLLSIPFLLSCILFAFAQNYWWYCAGRFIGGIGLGAAYMLVPMYLGEISEDRIRGGFGILLSVMANLGYLIPYGAGPWVSVPVLAAWGALIPIVYVLTFTWMPETPYYYTMKNEPINARRSLEWLRGTTDVDEEIEAVTRSVEFNLSNRGTLKELFTDKGNRKAIFIILGVFSAQQITGIAAIISYSTTIFNEVASDLSSSISVIITGIVQLVVAILVVFIADRIGRRPLLLASLFWSAMFLIGEGVYFHLKSNGTDVSVISWLPVTSIVGYLCSYTLGIGTLPMSLISELFPCNVKACATMIGTLYLSAFAAIVSFVYPVVSNAYGIHVAFYIFTAGTVLFTVFIYFYLPETKGRSLNEIQDILQGRCETESKSKLTECGVIDDQENVISSIFSVATVNVPQGGTISLK